METAVNRDVTLSFIAHALICGPASRTEANVSEKQSKPHPMILHSRPGEYAFRNSLLRWFSSSDKVIPADPWLYSLLQTDTCLVFGTIDFDNDPISFQRDFFAPFKSHELHANVCWNGRYSGDQNEIASFCINFTDLASNGFQILGDVIDIKMLVSLCRGQELFDVIAMAFKKVCKQKFSCHEVTHQNAQAQHIKLQIGTTKESSLSDSIIDKIELYREKYNFDGFIYVAEIKTNPGNPQPETLLANIWNECLGPQPIPFDFEARRNLIEKGRRHLELKPHIEAWEEMLRIRSPWVVVGSEYRERNL